MFPKTITNRLNDFFAFYQRRVDKLKTFIAKKEMAEELIILACCSLDHLSNCLFPKETSIENGFCKILYNHSGERKEFKLISVADFAYNLIVFLESLAGFIVKPGRVHLLYKEHEPFLSFIMKLEDIPLTEKDVRQSYFALLDALKIKYRIYKNQKPCKYSFGYENDVINLIKNVFRHEIQTANAVSNIKELIRKYKYSSILYREYRCHSVHKAGKIFLDDNNFWELKTPYFTEFECGYYENFSFLKLEFPAHFLVNCLETCIEHSKKAISGKGLLPAKVAFSIFEKNEFIDYIKLIDTEIIDDAVS